MRDGFDYFCSLAGQVIPLDKVAAPFTQQILRYKGEAREVAAVGTLCRRRLALNLLQAQSCGNHYT